MFRRILEFKNTDPFCPPIVRQTQTELEAHPSHGGRIVVVPATDQARGLTADLICADEACFITPDDALTAFFPMRKETGQIILLSTPNLRQGYFYDVWSSDKKVRRIADRCGRLDALVLNAGIVEPWPVVEMPLESWQRQIMVNLTSPFLTVQAALPHLIRQKGAIVGIASAAARHTGAGLSAYGVYKAGLVRLIQSIAFEYASAGVRANAVSPGWVRTEMGDVEMTALSGSPDAGCALATQHVPHPLLPKHGHTMPTVCPPRSEARGPCSDWASLQSCQAQDHRVGLSFPDRQEQRAVQIVMRCCGGFEPDDGAEIDQRRIDAFAAHQGGHDIGRSMA